jgi:hypothetical protein
LTNINKYWEKTNNVTTGIDNNKFIPDEFLLTKNVNCTPNNEMQTP